MRHTFFAVTLMSCLFPVAAWAAPVPASCSLIDHETLAALALGDAVTRVEHKTVPATAQAPEQHAEVCTFTPRVGASPSLSVMLLPLPGKNVAAKPVCNEGAVKSVGMASCFGVARGNMVTVSLVSPTATFAAFNATLRARFARLVDGGAAK
ncbi:hypothetical protein C5614_11015 [Massilia phosphatilytica]|jgi:hypothetical protein|nr:hypothetical protein C5614_11015 [Massilia phosphatilytica]